jgi:hypothetical protein
LVFVWDNGLETTIDSNSQAHTMATDHASRGPLVLAVTAATLACCTVFTLFRLISRFGIVKKPMWDDYFIILAWLLAFGTSFSICYGTSVGLGKHQEDIPSSNASAMKQAAYAFSVLYVGTRSLRTLETC